MTMRQGEIWLVIPWAPVNQGGVTGVVQNLIRHWGTGDGPQPQLVVNDWQCATPDLRDDALHLRFQVALAGSPAALIKSLAYAPLALWRLWRLLRSRDVQAVNFHYTDLAPFGIALLKRWHLYAGRLVISFHGTDVRAARVGVEGWLQEFTYRHADALVACSNSLADRFAATTGIGRDRVSVVLNGANAAIFRPDAPMTPSLEGRLPSRFLASVGAYIPRKAHEDLLSAFALLSPEFADVHLCIAGADGECLPSLRAQADALGLGARVHFFRGLGPEDVAAFIARALLCVQPALAESMPLAVLEAGAAGTPLVVSDIPGHDELISDGSTGHRFKVRDASDCARVIETALHNESLTRQMAITFRNHVLANLTWEGCAREYRFLYGIN